MHLRDLELGVDLGLDLHHLPGAAQGVEKGPEVVGGGDSAAAIVAGGQAADLKEGIRMAAESIDSGAAKRKLDALIEMTNA